TRFHAQFKERLGKAGGATQELLARNSLPAGGGAKHLGAGTRPRVHRIQHLGGEGAVAHASMPPLGGWASGLTVTDSGRGRKQRPARSGGRLTHAPLKAASRDKLAGDERPFCGENREIGQQQRELRGAADSCQALAAPNGGRGCWRSPLFISCGDRRSWPFASVCAR